MVKKASAAPKGAEADERRRLRSLAFSNGLLQRGEPAAPRTPLAPSTAVSRMQAETSCAAAASERAASSSPSPAS
jgi:hypothetical protein